MTNPKRKSKEESEKAIIDALCIGTGVVILSEDGIKCVPPEDIYNNASNANDGNVHVVPVGGQNPWHAESKDCWCEPDLEHDFTDDGGVKVYVHREIQ